MISSSHVCGTFDSIARKADKKLLGLIVATLLSHARKKKNRYEKLAAMMEELSQVMEETDTKTERWMELAALE